MKLNIDWKHINFIFFLGIGLFINNCFALIDFYNKEQINVLRNRIDREDIKGNLAENIQNLKNWQMQIYNEELNLSNQNISDNDLPLIKILLEYNQNIIALNLSRNPLTIFNGLGMCKRSWKMEPPKTDKLKNSAI